MIYYTVKSKNGRNYIVCQRIQVYPNSLTSLYKSQIILLIEEEEDEDEQQGQNKENPRRFPRTTHWMLTVLITTQATLFKRIVSLKPRISVCDSESSLFFFIFTHHIILKFAFDFLGRVIVNRVQIEEHITILFVGGLHVVPPKKIDDDDDGYVCLYDCMYAILLDGYDDDDVDDECGRKRWRNAVVKINIETFVFGLSDTENNNNNTHTHTHTNFLYYQKGRVYSTTYYLSVPVYNVHCHVFFCRDFHSIIKEIN